MSRFRYFSIVSIFGLMTLFFTGGVSAQDYQPGRTVIVNGAAGTASASGEYSSTLVVGEPFVLSTKGLNYATSTGLWGLQLNTPSSPNIRASEGDFSDRVIISWQLETLSPAPNKGYHIFRDGTLLARVSRNDTSYTDKNVQAGNFYFYTITAINQFGEGVLGNTTGFVNPNGTITGTVTTSKKRPVSDVEVSLSPVVGQSLSFDGTDDKVEMEETESLTENVSDAFTFSVWVNPSSAGTDRMIGGAQNTDGSLVSYPFVLSTSGNTFAAEITTQGGPVSLTGSTNINDSQWYHVALTYHADEGAFLYVNGSPEDSSDAITSTVTSFSDFILGEDLDAAAGLANWDGLIDEVRLWNIARDSTAIQTDKDRTISWKADGLLGYWRLDEGTGIQVFDLTANKTKGDIDGAAFSSTHANLPASAITDSLGNYQIEGIYYGSSTTFDVTPGKPLHTFTPALRNATLSPSNTGVNNVDFEDDSQIPVEGFVKFANTECFEDSVEILVDGDSTIPKTYTNSKGEYTLEFEPGTNAAISPSLHDHPFSPITHTVENIAEPVAGIEFIDNELVDLTVQLAGGFCEFPVGKAAVTVRTEDGCFNKEVTTTNAGFVTLRNIPANKYEVILKPEDPNIQFDGRQVNLQAGSDTMKFIYQAPLEAEIELISSARKVNGIPVLKMAAEGQDTTHFRFNLLERYGNNVCYKDTGKVKVIDKIALKESNTTVTFHNPDITRNDSMAVYDLIAGRPNFLDGGEHPFQKELQIEAEDDIGRKATAEFWAYVEGHKTEGNTFITTAPNKPLFILRDPPGDKSYSEITKEYSLDFSFKFDFKEKDEEEFESTEVGGMDEIEGEGVLIETKEQETSGQKTDVSITYGAGKSSRYNLSFSEVFRTDESAESADGKHDIIAGAAEDFLYGVTQTLTVNSDGTISLDKKLGIEPKGFKTFYFFTVGHIEDQLIPDIEASDLDEDEKQKQTDNWKEHLRFHNELTTQNVIGLVNLPQNLPQLLFKENVSFSAGAPYEAENSYRAVTSRSWDTEIEIADEVAEGLNIETAGDGAEYVLRSSYVDNASQEIEIAYEGNTSTKIVLDDATEGDAFSVDIETDFLGFPLYKLKGGQSTNPWEINTSKRDKVSLALDSYYQVNVPPNAKGEFTLSIGNESETLEERIYRVRLIPESNPDGAVISLGGETLPAINEFTVPSGETVQAKLEVGRGPDANLYEDIKLMAFAPGQYELWEATENPHFLNAVDTVSFTVQFSEACGSDVAIANFNNFVINKYDTTAYPVQVFGYNPNDPDFNQLLLEYQHAGEDFWIIADSVRADSIGVEDFYFMSWAYHDLQDGDYNLRVKAVCLDGTVSESNHLNGTMDRSSPTIFGEPSPVDNGVLGFGQDISLTFTEPIDTTTLFVDRIRLFNTEENREIPMRYSSDGTTIILTPEEQNRFIEGVRLHAEIDTLADMHGNWISEPITWEFEVDRNPIRWNQPELTDAIFTNQVTEFEIPLHNLSEQTTAFTITDIPEWMSVTPVEGNIGANGKIDISITIKEEINFGEYYDTLNVQTTEGNEPLKLNLRALEQPPAWRVDPLAYEYQMDMIGEVILRDETSNDPYDIVGVFVGSECRGYASPELVEETGEYLVFLNIYSNEESGEELSFRLWDAEDAEEYWKLSDSYTFSSNTLTGSVSEPVAFNSEGNVAQHISLNKGWTWISQHLESDNADQLINSALNGITFSEGDRVISYDRFESWSVSTQEWVPGIIRFSPMNTYQVYADSSVTVTFIGQEADPSGLSFTLVPGNNWIGYPVRRNLEINSALANLGAPEGSVIRNQTQFAEFVGGEINRWIGNLNVLRSGSGYIFTSTSQDTLNFSYNTDETLSKTKDTIDESSNSFPDFIEDGWIRVAQNAVDKPNTVTGEPEPNGKPVSPSISNKNLNNDDAVWELNVFEKQYNMPAIVELEGEMSQDTSWYIGAFINNTLSGIGKASYIENAGKYQGFMMIYHHKPAGDSIMFKLYHPPSHQVLPAQSTAEFNHTQILGSVEAPFGLKAVSQSDLPKEFALSQNYPNPFNPSTAFNFSLPRNSKVSIVIYNILGQKVAVLVDGRLEAGAYTVKWNAGRAGVASGMYLAEMKAGDFRQIRKLMLIK